MRLFKPKPLFTGHAEAAELDKKIGKYNLIIFKDEDSMSLCWTANQYDGTNKYDKPVTLARAWKGDVFIEIRAEYYEYVPRHLKRKLKEVLKDFTGVKVHGGNAL